MLENTTRGIAAISSMARIGSHASDRSVDAVFRRGRVVAGSAGVVDTAQSKGAILGSVGTARRVDTLVIGAIVSVIAKHGSENATGGFVARSSQAMVRSCTRDWGVHASSSIDARVGSTGVAIVTVDLGEGASDGRYTTRSPALISGAGDRKLLALPGVAGVCGAKVAVGAIHRRKQAPGIFVAGGNVTKVGRSAQNGGVRATSGGNTSIRGTFITVIAIHHREFALSGGRVAHLGGAKSLVVRTNHCGGNATTLSSIALFDGAQIGINRASDVLGNAVSG